MKEFKYEFSTGTEMKVSEMLEDGIHCSFNFDGDLQSGVFTNVEELLLQIAPVIQNETECNAELYAVAGLMKEELSPLFDDMKEEEIIELLMK